MMRLMNSAVRRYMASKYCLFDNILVNEFPKSGGTWLGQMLSELLSVPFPRNSFPKSNNIILHGHYINDIKQDKTIILWRDGRDVVVSWYYHSLFYNNVRNNVLVDKVRSSLKIANPENLQDNLEAFIEYSFTKQKHPRFSWSEFVNTWYSDDKVCHVKYEGLRSNPVSELSRIVEHLSGQKMPAEIIKDVVEKYSFEKQSGRKPGIEQKSSFMRKGLVGDWKNQFNSGAREIFDFYAGEALIKLDYEKDHDWVSRD